MAQKNIFVIPSYYPNEDHIYSGIYMKEQAFAIGEILPKNNIIISLWGNSRFYLSPKNLFCSLKNFKQYLNAKKKYTQIKKNICEYYTPSIEWSLKFFEGNLKNIIAINEHHFLDAQSKFGQINIIHAHQSFPAGFIGTYLSHKYNVPIVITEQMSPFPLPQYNKKYYLKKYILNPLKNSNKNIITSTSMIKAFKKYNLNNFVVIPNVIDESVFKNQKNRINKCFRFFTCGNMCPQKGIDILLYSISDLIKQNKNVHFRIGGEGYKLREYIKLAEDLKINKYITWLGPLKRTQVKKELIKCNCFILPSRHETFGIVYAEATAVGRPIIATNCGGPSDIVTKENGLLIKVNDIKETTNSMLYIIKNIKSYNSDKIRSEFLKKFSKRVIVKKIDKIYNKIISQNKYN